MNRNTKKIIGLFSGAIVLFALVFIIVSAISRTNKVSSIEELASTIDVTTLTPVKSAVTEGAMPLFDELPDISKYPLSVEGAGDIDIEIFASSEKAGKGKDGWLNDVANDFNKSGAKLSNGTSVSVSVRQVASGLAADYIVSGRYKPDAFAPSNQLFAQLAMTQGADLKMVSDRMVGNVAGFIMNKTSYKQFTKTYGEATVGSIMKAVTEGKLSMGYTNPLASSAGVNFLMSALNNLDSTNLVSDTAKAGFKAFQKNVPFVAYTTLQMRDSASKGKLSCMVMEYQSYVNDPNLKANYEFIPYGARHDNPIYSVGVLSDAKSQAMSKFVTYCKGAAAQKLATEYGFNGQNSYKGTAANLAGNDVMQAQALWKNSKDGDKPIISVFIADCSGSMQGEPIENLKKSLVNGMQYIGENSSVGLVSYSDKVSISLPIGKFSTDQKELFKGAVEALNAGGSTASYDAVVVAANMVKEAKKKLPNAKVMVFLLSDGNANLGYGYTDISKTLVSERIPVFTISYGNQIDAKAMEALANTNEAAYVNADKDDIIYKLKSLFNAQM